MQGDGISDQINGPDFDADRWSLIHSVSSRDVYMHHLYTKSHRTPSRKLSLELLKQIEQSLFLVEIFSIFLDFRTCHPQRSIVASTLEMEESAKTSLCQLTTNA